jgi:Leucine-rich repeat (LRR) protein
MNNIQSLIPLKNLIALDRLDCSDNQPNLKSLTGLENCINLTHLECNHTCIDSLEPIKNCTQIDELDCFATNIIDVSPIRTGFDFTRLRLPEYIINDIKCSNVYVNRFRNYTLLI